MAGQGNRVLISYNDVGKDAQLSSLLADRLAEHLYRKGKQPDIEVYRDSKGELQSEYDWLILIYTSESEAKRSPVALTVENALDLTVKRRMRGVLAITPSPAELPPEWATIRKYDASPQGEGQQVLEAVEHAMSYAKLPYTRDRIQELANRPALSGSRPSIFPVRFLVVALVALMTIFGLVAYFVTPIFHPPSSQATLTPSNLTATAQVLKTATRATATRTAQATSTVSTLSAAQTLYTTTIKPSSATFTGFRDAEKWDTGTSSCTILDAPQNTMYQASITTPNQYVRCMAAATNFKNFAYQVAMKITGDAGGVIFRSVEPNGVFYRFSVTPSSGEFAVILCQSDCAANTIDGGTVITKGQVVVDPTKAVTLTVIAKDSIVNLYVNGNFVYPLADKLVFSGAIGVYAASINTSTTVTFTNPKVWKLDKQPQPQGTPRG